MSEIFQATNGDTEQALKAARDDGLLALLRLPEQAENGFRQHARERAAGLLHQSIYGLVALYLLVVVPIYLLGNEENIGTWIAYSMLPIGMVLGGMWVTTRLPTLDAHVETTLCISLFLTLLGTVYCAMLLGNAFFGRMSSYMTIYILIIAFSILQLPAHLALTSALLAGVSALGIALLQGLTPYWLDVMLFFGVPLIICTVNGYILELAERRNYVQTLLLGFESQRLQGLREQAERDAARQHRHTEFLELISGNPGIDDLFSRTLAFLISHTGAQVAAAYLLQGKRLLRVATWAGTALEKRQQLGVEETVMGPALRSGDILRLENLHRNYLPVQAGSATLASSSIMVVPLLHNGEPLAVIELGKLSAFTDEEQGIANSIRTHLSYAVLAARAQAAASTPLAVVANQ